MDEDSSNSKADPEDYSQRTIHSSHIKKTRHIFSVIQPKHKILDMRCTSVQFRCTDEGIPQLALLDRGHCAVRHSLRRSQIKTGQLKFV